MHKKIKIIHGPNLYMLGIKEPGIYGDETLADLGAYIIKEATRSSFEFFKENSC